MLAFIKTNYQVGDPIEINCSEGVITGTIEFVNNKYIVLRQPNGKICGISAADIRTFTAASPVAMVPNTAHVLHKPLLTAKNFPTPLFKPMLQTMNYRTKNLSL